MPPRSSRLPRLCADPGRPWVSACVWALVLALLWAQMLGLAHSVRHVHGFAPAHVSDVLVPDHAHEGQGGHERHAVAPSGLDVLGHLQAAAGDEHDCRLYDQLGHAGPVPTRFGLLVHALPLVPAWVVLQSLQPRACVPFAARAPPVSR